MIPASSKKQAEWAHRATGASFNRFQLQVSARGNEEMRTCVGRENMRCCIFAILVAARRMHLTIRLRGLLVDVDTRYDWRSLKCLL